jgi:molybdopterin-containing oxidoreductase family membrane subunit
VAGASYSGFAMVLTLVIPVRALYGLQEFITGRHMDYMAKVMLATGLIVAYGYMMEAFFAWYSGNPYERYMMVNRAFGPYGFVYWMLILCNIALPQLLWIRKVRQNMVALFIVAIVVNIGMWLERFVIVITSLHRDFLPSSWGMYYPTIWDWATFAGSIGLFLALMFLFIRLLPMISMFELRQLLPWPSKNGKGG